MHRRLCFVFLNRSIRRHAVHPFVPWQNHKQWLMIHDIWLHFTIYLSFNICMNTHLVMPNCYFSAVFGCADPLPPENGFVERTDGLATIGCLGLDGVTWEIVCRNGEWSGDIGSCTASHSQTGMKKCEKILHIGQLDTDFEDNCWRMIVFVYILPYSTPQKCLFLCHVEDRVAKNRNIHLHVILQLNINPCSYFLLCTQNAILKHKNIISKVLKDCQMLSERCLIFFRFTW